MFRLKEVLSHRGFIEFLAKSAGFVLLLILELQFVIWKENLIPVNNAWFSLNIGGIGTNTPIRLILFLAMAFILLARKPLYNIKKFDFRLITFSFYFPISMLFAWLLRIFRAAIATNPSLIGNYFWVMFLLKFALPLILLITLFISVFGFGMISFIWHNLRRYIVISFIFTFAFFLLVDMFQNIWPFMSRAVVEAVNILLSISFEVTKSVANLDAPGLSVKGVNIIIGKACSGIDSQVLFLFLYSIILFMDWHELNKSKALSILLPGMIGMFCINIFRIYLLYLMAIFISVDFALTAFHSNVGWILFVLYFIGFDYFTYSWMRK